MNGKVINNTGSAFIRGQSAVCISGAGTMIDVTGWAPSYTRTPRETSTPVNGTRIVSMDLGLTSGPTEMNILANGEMANAVVKVFLNITIPAVVTALDSGLDSGKMIGGTDMAPTGTTIQETSILENGERTNVLAHSCHSQARSSNLRANYSSRGKNDRAAYVKKIFVKAREGRCCHATMDSTRTA